MSTLLVRWIIIVVAIFLVSWGLPQTGIIPSLISYNNDFATLAIFSAILALLNTFIRPVIKLLSLPLTCMTFGLFSIVINVALFALAGALTPNFAVANLWGYIVGAAAVSVVGVLANMLLRPD